MAYKCRDAFGYYIQVVLPTNEGLVSWGRDGKGKGRESPWHADCAAMCPRLVQGVHAVLFVYFSEEGKDFSDVRSST